LSQTFTDTLAYLVDRKTILTTLGKIKSSVVVIDRNRVDTRQRGEIKKGEMKGYAELQSHQLTNNQGIEFTALPSETAAAAVTHTSPTSISTSVVPVLLHSESVRQPPLVSGIRVI
jgi:hypothetical protein